MGWEVNYTLIKLKDEFSYKYEPHHPKKHRGIAWPICKSCGLVYLKNEFTRWAVRKGCLNRYHPDRRNARKRYT